METILAQLAGLGVRVPEILLPAHSVDISKWAVIACDQWTQNRDRWEKIKTLTDGVPSTFNMIFPEVYLEDEGKAERIAKIHKTMKSYLDEDEKDTAVFAASRSAGVYVERRSKHGVRKGFMLAIDLEKYDWRQGSCSLIRSTEETIEERLPPRMQIRHEAPLECPHILLLVNDAENILMSLFEKLMHGAPVVYNSPLMTDGGSVCGRFVYRRNDWAFISDILQHFYRSAITSYGKENAFLFAVGDGNHSLAAAKAVWEQYKTEHAGEEGLENHNARYALVEVVNLYDPAILFEPIHRAVLDADIASLLQLLRKSPVFSERKVSGVEELQQLLAATDAPGNRYGIIAKDACALFETQQKKVATVDIDPVLRQLIDEEAAKGKPVSIDYIHGSDELIRLTQSRSDIVGIMLPPFHKEGLFKTIAENGALPRKSFSMGSAEEKRFYLECRKLFC